MNRCKQGLDLHLLKTNLVRKSGVWESSFMACCQTSFASLGTFRGAALRCGVHTCTCHMGPQAGGAREKPGIHIKIVIFEESLCPKSSVQVAASLSYNHKSSLYSIPLRLWDFESKVNLEFIKRSICLLPFWKSIHLKVGLCLAEQSCKELRSSYTEYCPYYTGTGQATRSRNRKRSKNPSRQTLYQLIKP